MKSIVWCIMLLLTWASWCTGVANFTVIEHSGPVWDHDLKAAMYVEHHGASYRMYYPADDFSSMRLATSPDGIVWTDYPDNPIFPCPDRTDASVVKYYSSAFAGANSGTNSSAALMHYRMWYFNYTRTSGWDVPSAVYAESPDGIAWFNHIPVSQFGTLVLDPDRTQVMLGTMDVAYMPGASNTGTDWTFYIYYTQYFGRGEVLHYVVSLAFSANGYNWTGYNPEPSALAASPIFVGTLDGVGIDSYNILAFRVERLASNRWEAFYAGNNASNPFHNPAGIGYAHSPDGLNWTRQQILMTTTDNVTWRVDNQLCHPSIALVDCRHYKMWFAVLNASRLEFDSFIKVGYADIVRPGRACPPTAGEFAGILVAAIGGTVLATVAVAWAMASGANGARVRRHAN